MSDARFADVKHYVMFMGYPHSGHSVVGGILDAHPRMIVANELHALPKLVEHDFDLEKIFELILENSRLMAEQGARTNTGYNYNIPDLYQGRFERLEVIGDKKGGGSARYHSRHPKVLYRLMEILGPRLRVLHVIRNPYDNISSFAFHKARKRGLPPGNERIEPEIIAKYFERADAVLDCQSRLPSDQFYSLHYEDLVHDSRTGIRDLCAFLGQDATADFLDGCSRALYERPRERRRVTEWDAHDRRAVEAKMNEEPYRRFFERYHF